MIRSLSSLQVVESHVVFRSFSDLYEVEQRQQQNQSRRASASSSTSWLAPLRSKTVATSASRSSSRRSSTTTSSAGDAESTFGFHDLSRSSSKTSAHTEIEEEDIEEREGHGAATGSYLSALYDSKVEARLRRKEADVATLYDEPTSLGDETTVQGQDLSLKRFPPRQHR